MKKVYLILLLSTFAAATHAAENEGTVGNGPSGFINAFVNIPGNILNNVSSAFLTSISDVIASIGKAFADAGDDINNNGNISR